MCNQKWFYLKQVRKKVDSSNCRTIPPTGRSNRINWRPHVRNNPSISFCSLQIICVRAERLHTQKIIQWILLIEKLSSGGGKMIFNWLIGLAINYGRKLYNDALCRQREQNWNPFAYLLYRWCCASISLMSILFEGPGILHLLFGQGLKVWLITFPYPRNIRMFWTKL